MMADQGDPVRSSKAQASGKSRVRGLQLVAPDRAKHEEELEAIMVLIKEKEAAFKVLGRANVDREEVQELNSQRDRIFADLRRVQEQRGTCVEARRKLDSQIRELNQTIARKNDESNKLMAGLRYRNESRLDDAITKLEHDRKSQPLSGQQEKASSLELDELKRSKVSLQQYKQMKQEVEEERAKIVKMREERDDLSKDLAVLRTQEDEMKKELSELRSRQDSSRQVLKAQRDERDAVRKDLDELYTKQRELTASFRAKQSEYYAKLNEERRLAAAKRDEEKQKLWAEREAEKRERLREREEKEALQDPYEAKRLLCKSLIAYLEPLTASVSQAQPSVVAITNGAYSPVREDEKRKEGTFLRRKGDDDEALSGIYSGVGKRQKKSKKSSAGIKSSRQLKHNTVILDQFFTLGIEPPTNHSTLPKVIDLIKERLVELESASAARLSRLQRPDPHTGSESQLSATLPGSEGPSDDHQANDDHLETGETDESS